jgi:hypothetical protein
VNVEDKREKVSLIPTKEKYNIRNKGLGDETKVVKGVVFNE